MEYGRIEREFSIDASPEVVFEVISSPVHIREWWQAESTIEPVPGADSEVWWGDRTAGAQVVPITVVDAEPPRLFSFRWTHPAGEVATVGNSLLVTFELVPSGTSTLVRLTEDGFREMGWEAAVLEERYKEHAAGWDMAFEGLRDYLTQLISSQ